MDLGVLIFVIDCLLSVLICSYVGYCLIVLVLV